MINTLTENIYLFVQIFFFLNNVIKLKSGKINCIAILIIITTGIFSIFSGKHACYEAPCAA